MEITVILSSMFSLRLSNNILEIFQKYRNYFRLFGLLHEQDFLICTSLTPTKWDQTTLLAGLDV